jgi:hypothetical protein
MTTEKEIIEWRKEMEKAIADGNEKVGNSDCIAPIFAGLTGGVGGAEGSDLHFISRLLSYCLSICFISADVESCNIILDKT